MPNMKNAKKAVKTSEKRRINNNNTYKASVKTAIKNTERAILAKDKDKALENLKIVIKRLDKAAAAGVVKDNYVARNKSRLTLKVNAMK
ncbi:MAG: 30S ribosomal protein S20 [Bacilli bacterium]|nr:30S ribosomal protein S20 [Bacilli bacterium]